MYFKREIRGVADMGGIKFRTNNVRDRKTGGACQNAADVHVECGRA